MNFRKRRAASQLLGVFTCVRYRPRLPPGECGADRSPRSTEPSGSIAPRSLDRAIVDSVASRTCFMS